MHPDQIEVTVDLARELIGDQFAEWRSLPVEQVAGSGTVNAVFRLGDRLSARFPLQSADVASTRAQLESEAAAARELLGRTPFPTPEPVVLGEPGAGYPLPWSVQTWLSGTTALDNDPGDSVPFALDLAAFVRAVRAIDTGGRTFSGSGRGGDLRDHDGWVETCFANSEALLDVPRLRGVWAALRDLPPSPGADVMSHGDLIPGNVLVAHGRLVGVLDVGGVGPADPALDLVSAWHLLDEAPRRAFREELGCTAAEWERGKAWAFQQAIGLVWYYVATNPVMSRLGERTLARLTADLIG
jgi:aminoglycoside phosphotransferase (APT) family kinase protein